MYVKLDELREKLMITDKYSRYALVKARVLEPAQKELEDLYHKGECDLYFTYKEDKFGRSVEGLKFTIHNREAENEAMEELKPEDLLFHIRTWLETWLKASQKPKNKKWVDEVIAHLKYKNIDGIKPLYERLVRMQKQQAPDSFAAYSRHIIEEDFM